MGKPTKNQFPVMANMTVKSVREYLQQKQSIIVPLGVIEQHGYHLPLKTDALIAERVGRMIGERAGVLVAPTMYQSFSGGGLAGTINISPAVMSLVVNDMLVSLVWQGFRNIYLFLCHGGSENARALNDAIKLLLRLNPAFEQVMVALLCIWDCDPEKSDFIQGFSEGDWHAGRVETSIVMALEPGLVDMENLTVDEEPYLSQLIEHPDNYQRAEKIVDDDCVVPRMSQRPEIKVGVMGFPQQASPELGQKIIARAVSAVGNKIMQLESQADGVYKDVKFTPEPLIFDLDKK